MQVHARIYEWRSAVRKKEGKLCFIAALNSARMIEGETSGNFICKWNCADCEWYHLLLPQPVGRFANGTQTCFYDINSKGFLYKLKETIHPNWWKRWKHLTQINYFKKGINKVAQQVGEEAIELVIEAKKDNDEDLLNEAADLVYHFLSFYWRQKKPHTSQKNIDRKIPKQHFPNTKVASITYISLQKLIHYDFWIN
jgi:phosphoribosyl-ATP pyrophosphohydrolase